MHGQQNIKKKVLEKCCRENQNKPFVFSNVFSENRAVYEIMWKSTVGPDRPQMTLRHMRIACWVPTATNTHLKYAIFIAFPLQQWLHECSSTLCYTYIVCLVYFQNKYNFFDVSRPLCCILANDFYFFN